MAFKKIYICSVCGHKEIKWQGRCPQCGSWNSFVEDVIDEKSKKNSKVSPIIELSSPPVKLSQISSEAFKKISTGIEEFDRVLDGGVVKGQVILIGGVPGIGKSTLMIEIASQLSNNGNNVLYVSGEESIHQISHRAKRLGISNDKITVLCETDIEKILNTINNINPSVLIIDSIQTLYHPQIPSNISSPLQIKYSTSEIIKISKTKSIITFILAHVTKEGDIAGPKLLEHMVDTVLYFENDTQTSYRILRCFKNRFGSVDEIGIFEMTEKGIVSSVIKIDEQSDKTISGKTFTCIVEGSRPFLIRVEALVVRSFYPYPKRVFSSIDSNYAQILLASIEKNTSVKFDTYDVYINIPTAFKTKDRAIDLAICISVISSAKDKPIPNDTAFIGEVGMLGQIYPVNFMQKRITEIEKSGFKKVIIPKTKEKISTNMQIITKTHISEIFDII